MKKCISGFSLILLVASCSAELSTFQGSKWTVGSGTRQLANGKLNASWERTNDNRLVVTGKIDFKLETLYVRSFRNGNMQTEQIVSPDTEGNFKAELEDSQFARVLCVEIACFDI